MTLFDPAFALEVFLPLIVILDPPGALPVYLGLTKSFTKKEKLHVARRSTTVAFALLLAFALLGQALLGYLDISVGALRLSGGLLLLIIGLQLVLGRDEAASENTRKNIALVPLAVPLLAGPGVMVQIMVAVTRATSFGQRVSIIVALSAAMLVVYLMMRYAGAVHRVLREGGTTLVSRIAGVLCAAIAMQMMGDGVLDFAREIARALHSA